jgi:hypothetical protein
MMTTKLAINLREGTVDVEGTEEFVRIVYDDFKDYLSKHAMRDVPLPQIQQERTPLLVEQNTSRKKKIVKRDSSKEAEKTRAINYKPTFNTQLNLSGLDTFYDEWRPENNPEKILVFAVFLRDRLSIAPCTADDIYTCFFTLKTKTKTPAAFLQAFRDTQNRTHFIEFSSPTAIGLTITGENYFNEKLRRAKEPK